MVISLLLTLGLVAGDNCMNLVTTDFPRLSTAFNNQAILCRGIYSPVTPAKAFNDKIFTQDNGACWAYKMSAGSNRYRFVMSDYTDAKAQLYADPASSSFGQGNFYETAASTGDLVENYQCGPVNGCFGSICSCQEFSDHYAAWASVTWGRAEPNMPARLWWSANRCQTHPSCGIPVDIEININELAQTTIFPSTWDPSTPTFGGQLPEGMGWPITTTDDCKALCDAESRCTSWQTDAHVFHPTWHPTVHCWLFDRDPTPFIRGSGKTVFGVKCPTSAPAAGPGFELKGEGICVDGSNQVYGNLWSKRGSALDAQKCMEMCNHYDACLGVMSFPPLTGTTEWECVLNLKSNRGFLPTAADMGSNGWQRMDDNWAEWVGGFGAQHLGTGAISGVTATSGIDAYCYAKQDTTDPCGAAGSAHFGCCPQMPYTRLDAGRRAGEIDICTTTGEPHIIDFSQTAVRPQLGQTTHVEGDFVLYEGSLLEVTVRQIGYRNGPFTSGSGNNAFTMTGALIGYNTIEYFGGSVLSTHQTVVDRASTEVYWNGVLTTTQELCDVHLRDYACSCKYDRQVQVSTDFVNRHLEIIFNTDYMFRATTWWAKYGWMDIVLTVDPQNVGQPGLKLGANGVQELNQATIAKGSVARGGMCAKGGIIPNAQLLDYRIDCGSNNGFLANRLGGSMQVHDSVHAIAYCYRRRREESFDRRMETPLTEEEHVNNVMTSCDAKLLAQANEHCQICDTEFLTRNCLYDVCATGSLRGAKGSRDFCQEKLVIEATPGQEAAVCADDHVWDSKRRICRLAEVSCSDIGFTNSCVGSFLEADGCSLFGQNLSEEEAEAILSNVDQRCFECDSIGAAAQEACRQDDRPRRAMDILEEIVEDASELVSTDLPDDKKELAVMKKLIQTATKTLGRVRANVNKGMKGGKNTGNKGGKKTKANRGQ